MQSILGFIQLNEEKINARMEAAFELVVHSSSQLCIV